VERTHIHKPGQYIDFPSCCPWCGEDADIEYDTLEMESGCIWQKVFCRKCSGVWNEVYQAFAIEGLDSNHDPLKGRWHICTPYNNEPPLWNEKK